jgi:hypothetical protein
MKRTLSSESSRQSWSSDRDGVSAEDEGAAHQGVVATTRRDDGEEEDADDDHNNDENNDDDDDEHQHHQPATFVEATLSQASVAGAEQACTAIAVVACAEHICVRGGGGDGSDPERMEFWIRQGAALYAAWAAARSRSSSSSSASAYATAKEVLDLVSLAWRVCSGDEYGGQLWTPGDDDDGANMSLPEALEHVAADAVAVLTCGAFSLALLKGGLELFDSHPQEAHAGKAVLARFASRHQLLAYLKQRFSNAHLPYALCVVRNRLAKPPLVFAKQRLAFRHADQLPPGFIYVWARDTSASNGSKEYLAAGLEDFALSYASMAPQFRTHYDMARQGMALTFYADLEFELGLEQNAQLDGARMLRTFLAHVAEQWAEEQQPSLLDVSSSVAQAFAVFDSSASAQKVSYHVHHHGMWFADHGAMAEFMQRVQQRDDDDAELTVWRRMWNAQAQAHEVAQQFFADQSVYSRNRCFRLPYSSKAGSNRPFLPLLDDDDDDDDDPEHGEPLAQVLWSALISPPMLQLYTSQQQQQPRQHQQQQQQQPEERLQLSRSSGSFGGGEMLLPLDDPQQCPAPIRALGEAVAAHYKPERMRGFKLVPTGLITFSMVKHDCEICHDRHSNQVYVVADLKRRVLHQKCHVDRSKEGAEVAFPASLGALSMARPQDMQQDGIFPAESSTACMVLAFAQAIYAGGGAAPQPPAPGTAVLRYDNKAQQQYEVALANRCPHDGAAATLRITCNKLAIRCTSKACVKRGRRWERPSSDSVVWDLSFLFPDAAAAAAAAVVPSMEVVGAGHLTPEQFLAEPNFLRALGLRNGNEGAPASVYSSRLDKLHKWALQQPQQVQSDAHAVLRKVARLREILLKNVNEVCYRECLAVAPDFAYPVATIPRGPITLATELWLHLARRRGYKRSQEDFYVPATDEAGRIFYRAMPLDHLLTSVCSHELTPNLCSQVMWNGRVHDDLRRVLHDPNQFPSLPISKRYLGFANVVYDLERNVALTWDEVRADPSAMPFHFLDLPFPVEALERARQQCPTTLEQLGDDAAQLSFVPTPLFDGPLHDQRFSPATMFWLYALLGRMFHYVGKQAGCDNWEIVPFLLGAPSSFKSSIITIMQSFLQPHQVGVMGTQVESAFPLEGLSGKLMVFMSECSGCTLDRDLFKQMASGDSIRISAKHKAAANVPNWIVPMLYAGNGFLQMCDTDGSVERRTAVFPFLFMLRDGQGANDLAARIILEEGALLAIKFNTAYQMLRRTVKGRVQKQLPLQVREATHQAICANDSFKSFVAQCLIVDHDDDAARLAWPVLWTRYQSWCKITGRKFYPLDPMSIEAQTLFRLLKVRFSSRKSPPTVVHLRERTARDVPFRNVLEVHSVRGSNDEGGGSSSSSCSSGNE